MGLRPAAEMFSMDDAVWDEIDSTLTAFDRRQLSAVASARSSSQSPRASDERATHASAKADAATNATTATAASSVTLSVGDTTSTFASIDSIAPAAETGHHEEILPEEVQMHGALSGLGEVTVPSMTGQRRVQQAPKHFQMPVKSRSLTRTNTLSGGNAAAVVKPVASLKRANTFNAELSQAEVAGGFGMGMALSSVGRSKLAVKVQSGIWFCFTWICSLLIYLAQIDGASTGGLFAAVTGKRPNSQTGSGAAGAPSSSADGEMQQAPKHRRFNALGAIGRSTSASASGFGGSVRVASAQYVFTSVSAHGSLDDGSRSNYHGHSHHGDSVGGILQRSQSQSLFRQLSTRNGSS
jgi:hypothetical protein